MNGNPIPLHCNLADSQAQLALVTKAQAGLAINVSITGVEHRVAGHLSQVEHLQVGDQVLVTPTELGMIIIGRLRQNNEYPLPRQQQQDGNLSLEADQSLCLRAGQSRIEIHADGRIVINGKNILQIANGPLKLQGATIALN